MAQHAEAVGFDSLWLADHLIVNLGEALGVPGHPDRTLNEAASDPDSRHSDWIDIKKYDPLRHQPRPVS